MECYTGFTIECKTNSDAVRVAQAIKEYLAKNGLSDHYLAKSINIVGSDVKQDEEFCTEDFWCYTFEEMCKYVESQYPGLMIKGEEYYHESTGMRNQSSFERSNDDISFHEVLDDYDTIAFMIEDGYSSFKIARMTGLPFHKVEEYIREYNEWAEDGEFDEDDE